MDDQRLIKYSILIEMERKIKASQSEKEEFSIFAEHPAKGQILQRRYEARPHGGAAQRLRLLYRIQPSLKGRLWWKDIPDAYPDRSEGSNLSNKKPDFVTSQANNVGDVHFELSSATWRSWSRSDGRPMASL
jgi:hypothetical protein